MQRLWLRALHKTSNICYCGYDKRVQDLANLFFMFLPHCPFHTTQAMKNKWKKLSNNRTSVCVNPQCSRFQVGFASQNRDKQAAECMDISGFSLLLTGERLACFDSTSSKCTGLHTMSTATPPLDAEQLTVPTAIP